MAKAVIKDKSLEFWIWDAACSIRGVYESDRILGKILKQLGV
ncbi:MAG: hypothetical protein O3C43_24935 [Verrucomicrobia bacterium]|nr:hypothetical protein [Verrucomicrobiota bacterium]MDA1069736.1 hypothetical protein [Verrucomicrobiota bacterium]